MWLLLLEALAALGVLLFLVWWTMFAGRTRGESPAEPSQASSQQSPPQKRDSDA